MANRYLKITKFGGLDQRKKYSDDPRYSPDMNNFKVCEDGSIKKRVGSRLVNSDVNGSVYCIWSGYLNGEIYFIVCAGTRIYRYFPDTDTLTTINIIAGECKHIFAFGNALFFLCNSGYFKYYKGIYTLHTPYIPLVAVSSLADGSGTFFEKPNMLTGKKRQQFSADGSSTKYTLAEKNIDSVLWVEINGERITQWTADVEKGIVTFTNAPEKGLNNLEICWEKASTAKADMIFNCTRSMNFGGNTDTRVFLYGNPDYPNYRFYSELADGLPSAEYFPETNYTVIGNSTITDMVQQYDRQLIFTEDRAYYSYCEIRTDALGNYYPSFPVYNLNFEKGNLIKGSNAVIDNTPVTLSDDGLNRWVSTTVQDERNSVCFSQPISDTIKRILQGGRAGECCLYDRQSTSELYFSTPYGLYIYNYAMGIWYRYDPINAVQICEVNGKLYWLNNIGELYYYSDELTDDQHGVITAYWCSPKGKLGSAGRKFDLTAVIVETDDTDGTDITVTAAPDESDGLMNSQTLSVDGKEDIGLYRFRTEIKRTRGAQVTISSCHENRNAKILTLTFKTKSKEVER